VFDKRRKICIKFDWEKRSPIGFIPKGGNLMAFKKILVPVDFSEFSDMAVEYAMFFGEKFRANITLLHTVLLFEEDIDEEEHLKNYEKIIQKKENQRAKKLNLHRDKGKNRGLQVDSVLLRDLSAADSILDYVSDTDYDLIIMGTHGRTGLIQWISGSVAEKVVRFSPIPVLTIHKDFSMTRIDRILVPVDFSKHSKIAVQKGIAIANEFKADIKFVHVVEQEAHPEFYTISFDPILKANPQLKDHIVNSLKKLTGLGEDKAKFVVLEGSVTEELKKYAQENETDIIVMPTRGMSELEHIVLGSTTERMVRVAPCPVLTVRK
jgi:nucleotide-binding universal stress UspA family protein